jgi:flagellar motor switch protein FliN/FliY
MASSDNTFGIANYYSLWAQAVAATLSQFAGRDVAAEMATAGAVEADGERHWVTFTVSDALLGEQAFSVSKADVLHMGQMFIGEPLNPEAEFTADHADALAEVFRQFAGTVALQLKGILGTDCAIRFKDTQKPTWNSADEAVLVVKTEPQIIIAIKMDTGLVNSVTKVQSAADEPQATAEPEQPAVEQTVPEPAEAKRVPIEPPDRLIEEALTQRKSRSAISDKNLDLLLDVELEVSIRFGKRQMMLKDVLELNSGALVELDRRVRDPIELLLGGKVIARGEAVIVDGNYGIRITEIISPSQRLAEIA